MRLASLTRPEWIFPDLAASDQRAAFAALAERAAAAGAVPNAAELAARLAEREALGSTAIGGGVAIPHCKLDGIPRAILVIGLAPDGVDGAGDRQPVRVFFLVVSPSHAPAEHLQVLAAISRWIRHEGQVSRLLDAGSAASIYRLLEADPP